MAILQNVLTKKYNQIKWTFVNSLKIFYRSVADMMYDLMCEGCVFEVKTPIKIKAFYFY